MRRKIIQDEIEKVEENHLHELVKKMQNAKVNWSNKSLDEKHKLEKDLFKEFILIADCESIKNMMRSSLKIFIRNSICPELEETISEVSNLFYEICKKYVGK